MNPSRLVLKLVVVPAALVLPLAALAQNNLANLGGQTPPQAAASGAIFNVCVNGFVANPNRTLTTDQQDLFTRCTSMVVNSSPANPAGLLVDDATLRANVQAVAHEEVIAQGANQVETGARRNMRVIAGRLADLRAGVGGIRITGFDAPDPGNGSRSSQGLASSRPMRGGGAATDGFSRVSGFINGGVHWGNKKESDREDAFDYRNYALVAGADYRFTNDLVAGAAVNLQRTDSNVKSGPGGATDSNNYGVTLYGSYYRDAWYLDGHANYTRANFETSRNILLVSANPAIPTVSRTANGETEGNQYTLGVGTGYRLNFGGNSITPYARLEYLNLDIDSYSESGAVGLNLQVDKQKVKSLQSALGVQWSRAISTGFGVVTPHVNVEWNHEFDNDSRNTVARFVNDPFNISTFAVPSNEPDRDFFTVGAGASAIFKRGMSAFFNVESVLGYSRLRAYGAVAGVRMEF